MEEYEINSTYQETRFKAICAVLQTLENITIEDFVGVIRINKDDKEIARIDIREK